MVDILDYQLVLEPGDMKKIEGPLTNYFDKMFLEHKSEGVYDDVLPFVKALEGDHLVREFNNRVFSLRINYVLAKKYLEKGIPDDPYYQSPGKNGKGVSYFPLFQEKHYANHYWYGFYIESIYFRSEGIVDSIYHLLNFQFDLDISSSAGFQLKIRKALAEKGNPLVSILNDFHENEVYKKAKKIRNHITHNFNPNSLSSGLNIQKNDGGKIVTVTGGLSDYMKVSEIQENIDRLVPLLAAVVEEVCQHL